MEKNTSSKQTVKIPEIINVKKFSELLNLPVSKVITELMKNQIVANINEDIDFDTASIIADDLGFEVEQDLEVKGDEVLTIEKLLDICAAEKESGKNLHKRPPVVTILGHVDHGKTTLLDTIRKANVVGQESGGITQHISAYQVKKKGQLITFVDTPGHEAFAAMRERGVSIADIAVLVVAADDGVRPQTKEVISYLKDKNIPTVVAINKIDKPEANATRVKQELAENDLLIEEWGGQIATVEVSAKAGTGINDLLENILVLDEVEDFKANDTRDGLAVVLESHLDPKKGPVATVLVKTGTLKVGQDILAGETWGRIRRIEDFSGKNLQNATPSTPVTIIGLNGTPNVNDVLQVRKKEAGSRAKFKAIVEGYKQNIARTAKTSQTDESEKKLNIIIKTDVQGSLEAIEQILETIKSEDVILNIVNSGVGSITESDVKIAQSSDAVIYGFHVEATSVAKRLADPLQIKIKSFSIIYDLIEDIKSEMSELIPPEIVRTDLGQLKVLAIFKTGKKDMIVGGRVTDGKIIKGQNIEVVRDKELIGIGILTNLQQNKKDTPEVKRGNECGLTFEGKTKIAEGDKLICYKEEAVKKKI